MEQSRSKEEFFQRHLGRQPTEADHRLMDFMKDITEYEYYENGSIKIVNIKITPENISQFRVLAEFANSRGYVALLDAFEEQRFKNL